MEAAPWGEVRAPLGARKNKEGGPDPGGLWLGCSASSCAALPWSSPLVPVVWDARVLLVGDTAGTTHSPALGFPSRSALGQPLFVTSFGSRIPFLLLYLGPESGGSATSSIDGGTHGHRGTTPGTERCPKLAEAWVPFGGGSSQEDAGGAQRRHGEATASRRGH